MRETYVLLAIIIYLASTAMAGKCSGKWAIHACGGGNGKRSDLDNPSDKENSVRDEIPEEKSWSILRRLARPSSQRTEEDRSRRLPDELTDHIETRQDSDDEKAERSEEDFLENTEHRDKPSGRPYDKDELIAALRLIRMIKSRNAEIKLRRSNDVILGSP